MGDSTERRSFGPYTLVRPLSPNAPARRWLALHERNNTSHVLYEFDPRRTRCERRRFLDAVEPLTTLKHPHVLTIREFSFGRGSIPWLVVDYVGNQDGLLALDALLEDKGGRMALTEAERAVAQLLEAFGHAHEQRCHHGPLNMDEILIDRHGSLSVELFGLSRRLQGLNDGNDELERDEVRSVAEIAYQLITGLRPEEPSIPAASLVKRLSREWEQWLEHGLDPAAGFESAHSALDALPSQVRADSRPGRSPVKVVLGRVRSAMRT